MGRIICITGHFDVFNDYGHKIDTEFVVSHGINEDTEKTVILPCEHPRQLGAKFDHTIQEWVLND